MEKWGRAGVYCDATDVPLPVEHILANKPGGSDRVSNLTLACEACNQSKGTLPLAVFLTRDVGRRQRTQRNAHPAVRQDPAPKAARARWEAERLERIQSQRKSPLRDAALMNGVRWRLDWGLRDTGLPVKGGSGGRTQFQRIARARPKAHYFDALCVGESTPESLTHIAAYVAIWTAIGRGNRQMGGTNQNGSPIWHRSRQKIPFGFRTGDLVVAPVSCGKYAGVWTGRVSIRASGSFDITAGGRRVAQGISRRYCRTLQRSGGWHDEQNPVSSPGLQAGASRERLVNPRSGSMTGFRSLSCLPCIPMRGDRWSSVYNRLYPLVQRNLNAVRRKDPC